MMMMMRKQTLRHVQPQTRRKSKDTGRSVGRMVAWNFIYLFGDFNIFVKADFDGQKNINLLPTLQKILIGIHH